MNRIDSSPLGKGTDYPDTYTPGLLFRIARADGRPDNMPEFYGEDVWNAWELGWLSSAGAPQVTTAEIRVPADSPNIVESKSLKLYLNSFAMSRFSSDAEVESTLQNDLSEAAGAPVVVQLAPPEHSNGLAVLPGICIDSADIVCERFEVDNTLLVAGSKQIAEESLHSHALRSLCPVTSQPDTGSLLVRYRGPRIDRDALFRYIVSYRQHEDFHEACVERIFRDISQRCRPDSLLVYARYQRRGGIDINPHRASAPESAANLRLWRQ